MDEDEPSRSALKLAWLWVIEYVASLQEIDPSFLHGLIAEAPEFLGDLGKETREMVALRCLEDLFGSRNEGESDAPSAAKPKFTFDISNSCEDVLLSILKETSISDLRTGPDLLKWDMQPFIVHKRTTMPKCSLERLKDELLEGAHPCTASLIEHSGLMHKDADNDQLSTDCFEQNVGCRDNSTGTINSLIMAREGSIISLPLENGDSHHQNLLPMKRNGNVVHSENQADYPKDQGHVGDGDFHLKVKRFKCNVSSANEAAELTLSPQFDEFVEESSKRMNETREQLHAERESQIEGLGKCVSSENGHEKFVAADRIVRNANAEAIYEIEHNQCENADDATKMPQHTFGDGPCQDIRAGEANEEEIRKGTSSGRTLQKVYVDDNRDNSNCGNQQKSPIDVSSSGVPREISVENSEYGAECLYEEDTSSDGDEYHHEKVDVAMERSQFLSSHCTLSHVSLSNYTKLSLCVKCSKDDQLLVCNAVDCSMAVHERCLGCSARFDKKGNFYCPFCTYLYAISKYMEAKATAASAKKELARFIHKDRGRSLGKKHDKEKQKLGVEESDETNGRQYNNELEKRKVEKQFEEPIISCADANLMQREEEPDITHGMSPISSAEKESEGMTTDNLSVRGLDRQDHGSFDPKITIANRQCRDGEILINEREGEGGIQKEVVGQQSNDLLEKPVCAVNSVEGKTTNEKTKEDKVFSDSISLKLRRTDKQYVSPEKYRWIKPNRVPWTPEEEQMLKEGVKKFSCMGEKIPWKQILEYGSLVFLNGRSAMQLKDKWRNMERKS
ncbi:uncharacterized protein [Euphorbia lathyris]|uniref:uncharacterized protein n=1 Tax=Euphorbia lathyris TaxID=212925 RepID=UPI0033142D2E